MLQTIKHTEWCVHPQEEFSQRAARPIARAHDDDKDTIQRYATCPYLRRLGLPSWWWAAGEPSWWEWVS